MTTPKFRVHEIPAIARESKAERAERARVAIESIVSLSPPAQRAGVRRELENPKGWSGLSGSSDAAIAEHLSVLAAIGNATIEEERSATAASRAKSKLNQRNFISIDIALVDALDDASARAIVIRRPDLERQALVLVRESESAVFDLSAAVQAAVASVRRSPAAPRRETRFTIRAGSSATVPRQATAKMLEDIAMLRSQTLRTIDGVGTGRTIGIAYRLQPKR